LSDLLSGFFRRHSFSFLQNTPPPATQSFSP
jgi:hypothetical protein